MLKTLFAFLALATASACDVAPFYANTSRDIVVYAPLASNNYSTSPAVQGAAADPRPYNPAAFNYAYIADTTGGLSDSSTGSMELDSERSDSTTGVFKAPVENTNHTGDDSVDRPRYGNLRKQ